MVGGHRERAEKGENGRLEKKTKKKKGRYRILADFRREIKHPCGSKQKLRPMEYGGKRRRVASKRAELRHRAGTGTGEIKKDRPARVIAKSGAPKCDAFEHERSEALARTKSRERTKPPSDE